MDLQVLDAWTDFFDRLDPVSRTRFSASDTALPLSPPPYSSIVDDVLSNIRLHLYKDILRQIALHPVKLKAGQTEPMAGPMGRNIVSSTLPEARGGRILDNTA